MGAMNRARIVTVWLLALCLLLPAAPVLAENLKVVVAEASYVLGDSDTLAGAEENLLLRAKRKAVEEAGVYIETASEDIETHSGGVTSHLNLLGVRTIAAAVTETQILEKRRSLDGDRIVLFVKIKATVHLDTLTEAVKRVKSDEQLASHHRQLQTENTQLKTELESLRRQLQTADGVPMDPRKIQRDRRAAIALERAAIRTRSLTEKIDLVSRAIAADNLYVDAYIVRGQTYLKIASTAFGKRPGRSDLNAYVERAIGDFDRALDLDPSSTWALLGRGDALTWQKKMMEAAKDYERILHIDPLFDVARQRLIAVYTTMARKQANAKQWDQALDTLDRMLRTDSPPSWVAQEKEAFLLRSQIYTELGDMEHAVEDLSRVLRVDPANTDALLLRAKLYRRLLQGRSARDDFEHACSLGSETACAELQ
jgi:pentatricopeptide repeat protein